MATDPDVPYTMKVAGNLDAVDIDYSGILYTSGRAFREQLEQITYDAGSAQIQVAVPLSIAGDLTLNGVLRNGAAVVYPGSQYVTDNGAAVLTIAADTVLPSSKALTVGGNISGSSLTVSNAAAVQSLAVTAAATAASLTVSGNAASASADVAGHLTAASADVAGTLSCNALTATSMATLGTTQTQDLTSSALNVSGATVLAELTAASVSCSGALSAGITTLGATTTTDLTASSLATTGSVSGASLAVSGNSVLADLSATSIASSGALSAGTTTLGDTGTQALTSSSITSSGSVDVGTYLSVVGSSVLADVSATSLVSSGALTVSGTSDLGTTIATGLSASSIASTGTLSAAGSTTLAGLSATSINTAGNLSVTGTSTLSTVSAGAVSATSLSTTGAVTVGAGLTVTSASSLYNVSADSLTVSGVTRLGYTETGVLTADTLTSLNTLTVPGKSTLSAVDCGSIVSSGSLSTAQSASIGSDLSVTGALIVAAGQQSTLNGAVVVANDLTMSGGQLQFSTSNTNTSVPGGLGARIRYSTPGGTSSASEYASGLGASTLWHNTPSSGSHIFYTNGTERAKINAAGLAVTGTASVSSDLTVTGVTVLNSDVTVANSKSLTVTGNAALSTVLTSGLATLSSASVTNALQIGGISTLQGDVSITGAKTLTVGGNTSLSTVSTSGLATLHSATVTGALLTNGNVTLGDAASDVITVNGAATFANGLTSTGATTLGAVQASSLTATGQVQAGSLSVTGAAVLASASITSSLSAGATTVTSMTVNGNSTTTGQVSGGSVVSTGAVSGSSLSTTGTATVGGLLSANSGFAVTGNASVTGSLAIDSLNIKGNGQFGTVFNPPAVSGQSVAAASDRLTITLSPVAQTALGFLGVMVPVVNTLNVSMTPAGGSATVYQISGTGASVTTITLFAYLYSTPSTLARFATSSTTSYEIYGLTPGTTYSIALSYTNDVGTGTGGIINTSLLAAGTPAAPTSLSSTAGTVTGDYSPYTFTWTAPTVTDSANPAQNPQPSISKYTYQYAETSTVSSVSTLASSGALTATTLPTISANLRPGTVYSLTASATNSVNAAAGTTSAAYVFPTDYPESRFNTGTLLTNAASLSAPSVGSAPYSSGRFPAASYISRAGVALTSSDVLAASSFSLALSNLRVNDEPNPTASGAAASTFALAHSGGATASVNLLYTDSTTKSATSSYCTLTLQPLVDCNTTAELGFYKQVPTTTLSLAALPGQYASQSITLTQTLTRRGTWGFASNAYSYVPQTASNTYVRSNALTFYVEDTASVPSIVSAAEKTTARTGYAAPSIVSGIGTVPVSSSAFTCTTVVAASKVGSYWFPVGPVATVAATSPSAALASTSLSNTTSVCQPLYSDAAATSAVASGTALVSASTYYRSVSAVINTVGITALYTSFTCSGTMSNSCGTSASTSYAIANFRFDGTSLAHPHLTSSSGKSTLYGERVTFTTLATYPDVTLVIPYSHSESIVGNSKSYYNSEQVLFNGVYQGNANASWNVNYASQGYLMHPSTVLPNYSLNGSGNRYACFRWYVDTSSSFQTISVSFDAASFTGYGKTILYKFVDLATGAGTTKWLDLFTDFSGGAITSAADGAGGRVYSSTSKTSSNTMTSVTSSGIIYMYIGVSNTSYFTYKGVTISDYTTGAVLQSTFT